MRKLVWFSLGFGAACCLCAYVITGSTRVILAAAVGFQTLFAAIAGRKFALFRRIAAVLLGFAMGMGWFILYDGFYLNAAGTPRERTYVVGSPMAEVLHDNLEQIKASDILKRLGLEKGKYILLSAHREENIDTEANFFNLMNAVNAMAEKYDMPILYSCHPRSKKFIEQRGFRFDPRVIQHQPLGFHDYNHLQMNAFAVVSDSGTLPEESSFFLSVGNPIPAVCIRTSTERPEALDKGNFILAGLTTEQVLQAVDVAVEMNRDGALGLPVPNYVDENVSVKVVKLIQSYTGVVNKMVWRKY